MSRKRREPDGGREPGPAEQVRQAPAPETLETSETPARRPPRPRNCRQFARARMAEAMPELVAALVDKSQSGSLGHMRLLVQLSGLDEVAAPSRRRRSGGAGKALVEAWREADG